MLYNEYMLPNIGQQKMQHSTTLSGWRVKHLNLKNKAENALLHRWKHVQIFPAKFLKVKKTHCIF